MQKLERLIKTAGMGNIDFKDKYAAIKMHFGEYGNLGVPASELRKGGGRRGQRIWGESLFSLTAIPSMWDHGKMLWIIWTMLTGTALSPYATGCQVLIADRTERNGRSDRAHRWRVCERSKNRPRINGRGYSDLPDTF